jgi:hypothetical protein
MKAPVILYIITFLGAFFSDLATTLGAIGFLILTDTFTGIWFAWKEGAKKEGDLWRGWKHVTSRKGSRIIIKLILYPLAIIVSKVGEDYFMSHIPWIDVTAGILAGIEIKSIFENIGDILGFNLWQRIRERIWPDKIKDSKDE